MNKKNLILIGAVLLIAVLLMALALTLRPKAAVDEVAVLVDGREYARVPLSNPHDVTVDQGDGRVNVIHITDRGAIMQSSTCDNQLCVHMGAVTLDNWMYRPNQHLIVCLPNRVTVELRVAE